MSTLSGDSVSSVVRLCFGLASGLFLIGVCFVFCCLVRKYKNGQVLLGSLFSNCFVSGIASRGRFPWRGAPWITQCHGPLRWLLKSAGRPMGPATPRWIFPWDFVRVCASSLFGYSGQFCPAVVIVFLRGWYVVCWFACPLRPDPCLVCCLRPSFSLFVGCARRRRSLFFSFFFSGAGETQALVVWVSPCVSSSRPRSRTSTRTSCSTSTSRSGSRTFFFSTSFVFPVVVGLGLSGVCWGCRLLLLRWLYTCTCSELLEEMARMFRSGSQTIIWPQLSSWLLFRDERDGNCTIGPKIITLHHVIFQN